MKNLKIKHLGCIGLIALIVLLGSGLISVNAETNFADTIKENYEYYRLRESLTEQAFQLDVYDGIYNGDVRLGIYYVPSTEYSSYKCMIYKNETYYYLKSSKNVVTLPVIVFDQDFQIRIIDTYNPYNVIKTIDIKVDDAATIKADNTVCIGNNNPTAKVVTPSTNSLFMTVSSYVWIIGMALLGLILSLLSYRKSTASILYKPNKESSDFDFNAFLNKPDEEFPSVKKELVPGHNQELKDILKDDSKDDSKEDSKEKSVSADMITDVARYLKDKGYPYDDDMSQVSEDVKNQMMMDLMALKDQKRISKEDYLKAVMIIWKK